MILNGVSLVKRIVNKYICSLQTMLNVSFNTLYKIWLQHSLNYICLIVTNLIVLMTELKVHEYNCNKLRKWCGHELKVHELKVHEYNSQVICAINLLKTNNKSLTNDNSWFDKLASCKLIGESQILVVNWPEFLFMEVLEKSNFA